MAIRSSKKKIKNLLTNFSLELILFLVNRLFNDSLVFCPMDEIKIKLKYSFFSRYFIPVYTAHPMAHSVFLMREPRNRRFSVINGSR